MAAGPMRVLVIAIAVHLAHPYVLTKNAKISTRIVQTRYGRLQVSTEGFATHSNRERPTPPKTLSPGPHPPDGPVPLPQEDRGVPGGAVRHPSGSVEPFQPDQDAQPLGGRPGFRQAGPRLPPETARHLQRDGGPREDAQGTAGVPQAAPAAPQEPERGLLVPQHLCTGAR